MKTSEIKSLPEYKEIHVDEGTIGIKIKDDDVASMFKEKQNLEYNPESIKKNLPELLQDAEEIHSTSPEFNQSEIYTGDWMAHDSGQVWSFSRSFQAQFKIFSPASCVGFQKRDLPHQKKIWNLTNQNILFRYKVYPPSQNVRGQLIQMKTLVVELGSVNPLVDQEKSFLEMRLGADEIVAEWYVLKNHELKHLKKLKFERVQNQDFNSCEQILADLTHSPFNENN
jgi:hypothetical protein